MAKQKGKAPKRQSKPKRAAAASDATSGELSEASLDEVRGGAAKMIDCEGYAYLSEKAAGNTPTKKQPRMDGVVILNTSLPGGD